MKICKPLELFSSPLESGQFYRDINPLQRNANGVDTKEPWKRASTMILLPCGTCEILLIAGVSLYLADNTRGF